MIKIYDKNNNFITQMDKYKNLYIEKGVNQLDLLFFNVPKQFGDIFEEEGYIETKGQGRFVIKERNLGQEGYQIVGKYDLEDLNEWISAKAYVTETPKQMLDDLLNGKGWNVVSNITIKRTVTATEMSIIAIIKKIVDTFNAEVIFDNVNKIIYVEEELGEDKGTYFHDELNLRRINISSDTYDFATRMIPRGVNGEGIEQINNGIPYVENHSYSDKIVTVVWEDERYTNMNELKADAEKKLELLAKPRRAFSCDTANLAKVSKNYSVLDYNLGDTITLLSKDSKVREKQRIMKMVIYPDNPLLDRVEIENRPRSLGDKQEQQIESLEVRNGVIKANLQLLEDSVVSTVEKIENMRIDAENRLYQSQTQIPFDFNSGIGEIQLLREAFHPYYKVTSDSNIDLSASFPQSQYAEDLEGEEVTISLDVLVDVDRIVTLDGKQFEVKGNRWTRIHVTGEFPENTTINKRVRIPYNRKITRDKIIGNKLIESLSVDINTLYYRNLQVQKGNINTNWTLTPEELEGQINRYSSEIKQLADLISLKVSKGEIISEINLSPEEIKILAEKIKLEGTVTANENFKVLEDGSIEAKNAYFEGDIVSNNADISGKVTATSGKIGGYDISGNNLVGNDVELKPTEIKIGTGALINTTDTGIIGIKGAGLRIGEGETSGNLGRTIQFTDPDTNQVRRFCTLLSRDFGTTVWASTIIPESGITTSSDLGLSATRYTNIYLVNQPNVSSDIRQKSLIQDIPKDLISELKEVNPKMYKQGTQWHFGYIAQDIERAIYKYALNKVGFKKAKDYVKEFAVLHRSESYMSLLYGEIAVLKEEETRKEIERLEDRIARLERLVYEK